MARWVRAILVFGTTASMVSCVSTRNPSNPAIALNAIDAMDLCYRKCGVVFVDTLVRLVPESKTVRWEKWPVYGRLRPDELAILRRAAARLIADSTRAFPASFADTSRVVVARIEPASSPEVEVYEVLYYTPVHAFALWRVTLARKAGRWTVQRTEKLAET